MNEYNLNGSIRKTAFLMDKIPPTRTNSIAMTLMYWKIFDGIEIPENLIQEMIEKATAPETILRAQRKAKEYVRKQKLLELMDNQKASS